MWLSFVCPHKHYFSVTAIARVIPQSSVSFVTWYYLLRIYVSGGEK